MNKKLSAPFGWVGGKSKLADEIVQMIPAHKLYVEVFGGALNILYSKNKSKLEVVNDINKELVNLHKSIRNNPKTLSMYLNQLLISRQLFDEIKNKKIKPRNNIEAAAFYLYILTQSFGSKGDNFGMSAKAMTNPYNIYKSYMKWSNRLKGVTVENKSFEDLIELYDSKDTFFYCDPPYVETESYYKNTGGFDIKEHRLLSEKLKNIEGRFLISYNDHKVVRELYKDFNILLSKEIDYTLGKNMHKKHKKVREIYITNYKIENSLFSINY
ncbi:DNA adenine methylase [Halarcobacter sp.]|uniref:DNA adenine methylase n=1 Tax=Halarcobacter sp. TaxID=2321133 RepID=UPI003A90AF17